MNEMLQLSFDPQLSRITPVPSAGATGQALKDIKSGNRKNELTFKHVISIRKGVTQGAELCLHAHFFLLELPPMMGHHPEP